MFLRYILHQDEVTKLFDLAKRMNTTGSRASVTDVSFFSVHPNLFKLCFGSLCYNLLAIFPLASVNGGAYENWFMVYITTPIAAFLGITPFVFSAYYAIEDIVIPVETKIKSIMAGTLTIAFVHASFVSPWSGIGLFPFPFLPFVLGAIGLFPVFLVIYFDLTRSQGRISSIWILQFSRIIVIFVFTVLIALCWACVFRYLKPYPLLQSLWSLIYSPSKYVSKFVLFAPVLTHTNPRHWLIMTMVVEIFFARFQTAVVPFACTYWSIAALLVESAVSPAWKYYGGSDRLVILWYYFLDYFFTNSIDNRKSETSENFRSSIIDSSGILRASLKEVYQMNMDLNDETQKQLDNDSFLEQEPCGNSFSISTSSIDNTVILHRESNLSNKPGSSDESDESDSCFQSCCSRGISLLEHHWQQRLLFWMIESISSETISIIIRFQALISSMLLQFGPTRKHRNTSFDVFDESHFRDGIIMGTYALVFDVLFFLFYGWIIARKIKVEHCNCILSVKTFTTYVYEENARFLGLWLIATGMFVTLSMINHFGVDFSLQFEWLSCTNGQTISWPKCV